MEFKPQEMIGEFVTSAQRILTVSKKPDTPQYITMLRITALGLVVLGVLGFVVELINFIVRTSL